MTPDSACESSNEPSSADSSSSNDAETIFYLQTSTPHTHNFKVSGPYHPLDAIIPEVVKSFGNEYRQGREKFQESFVRDGHVSGFEQLSSPINNNPSQTKVVRLIREHNPDMVSRLSSSKPRVVMQTEMLFDIEVMMSLGPSAMTNPPMRNLVPKGAFETKAEANARSKELAEALVAKIPGSRIMDRSAMTPGLLSLSVVNDQSRDPPVGFSFMATQGPHYC